MKTHNLEIIDVTQQNYTPNRYYLLTAFPKWYHIFTAHVPPSDIWEGAENDLVKYVFQVEYDLETRKRGLMHQIRRIEVWIKGGDWNVNPFTYFMTDIYNRGLYYIPELSPRKDSDGNEVIDIKLTPENVKKFIKEKFVTSDGKDVQTPYKSNPLRHK
ncbi:MAG: hypothetical protein ACFFBD_25075 [Candidatus Hodarchaeota archaeon]